MELGETNPRGSTIVSREGREAQLSPFPEYSSRGEPRVGGAKLVLGDGLAVEPNLLLAALVAQRRFDEPPPSPVERLVERGPDPGHGADLEDGLPLAAAPVGRQILVPGLDVVGRSAVEIVEEADPELQRASPVRRRRCLDHELVDIFLHLLELKADDAEVAGVVELEQIEDKGFPIEVLRRIDGERLADESVVDLAGVFKPDAVDLEGRQGLSHRSPLEFDPPFLRGREGSELIDLEPCGLLADRRGLPHLVETDK